MPAVMNRWWNRPRSKQSEINGLILKARTMDLVGYDRVTSLNYPLKRLSCGNSYLKWLLGVATRRARQR